MIKRNGVNILHPRNDEGNPNVRLMNARTKNVTVAKETLDIIKQKGYTSANGVQVNLTSLVEDALNNTVLYRELIDIPVQTSKAKLEVTNETTTKAAVRLAAEGKTNIVALNFASARNQGGGFLAGAMAQEEDLCRCSSLYACLKSKPIFYNDNIICDDNYYTHNVLYSPNVPFFRDEHLSLIDSPFTLSLVTSPAPNVSSMEKVDYRLLRSTLEVRVQKIFQVAMKHGHKNIILGAWGCGAFGNDPKMVAEIFLNGLQSTNFEHVSFAVYDHREPPVVYEAFRDICK